MDKKVKLLVLFWLLALHKLWSQDPQFSQFYAAPLYLNPAFAGSTFEHRFIANHRLQWPSLPQAFVTYAFSYDYNMAKVNSGFGFLVTTDKAGSANLRSTNLGMIYAYKVNLPSGWVISPAVHFSYTFRDIDFSKLVFGDQLTFNNQGAPTSDPTLLTGINGKYFDFGSGILAYNKSSWLGFSAFHLNEPNESLVGKVSRLPMRISIHGGYRIQLYQGPKKGINKSSIAPSFVYKRQGNFDQLDIGFHFHYNPIMAGLWYRGIPIQQTVSDNISQDAVTFLLGLRFDNFDVGYSYDITVSRFGINSGGSHEISMMYQFNVIKAHKIKRKEKFIPCPTF